ncbi:uncharacterized protein METZ01_LOCUS139511 [marine metagenome]|uniref:Fe2OG dioxygenase domain-containing protein n=1 Tax=marine metagenome TaxID=408172 RepID=A0A381ZD11_9ZZZZ
MEQLIQSDFPWYFQPTMVTKEEVSPGGFDHTVYHASVPISRFYSHFIPILEQLNVAILIRIRVNLNPRLPEPYVFQFHTDTVDLGKAITNLGTTSILYINTNNGYTELEDGTKIESVANRLATFPTNTKHRIVTQTDEQTRILINLNYLKCI